MILPRQGVAPVPAPVTEDTSSVSVDGVKSCVSGNFSQCTLGIIAVVLVGISTVMLAIWYFFHRRSKNKQKDKDRKAAIDAEQLQAKVVDNQAQKAKEAREAALGNAAEGFNNMMRGLAGGVDPAKK